MSSRQRDKYRKFDSGHQKRLRKLKLEQNLEKQRGALDQFVFSSNIPEIVQNETENYEDELMLCDIEQPCCSKELVTQNSIEVVEKDNSLTFNNKIVNKTKEDELMLSDIEQPCCSKEFVTQNSIEVVEKDSSLTFNKKIVNKNKEGRIDFRDPAQWPQLLTHDMRVEIVLSKSEKIEFYENYPKNEQKRKFSLIEMMAKFDPVIQEHVRRIRNGETHDHYLEDIKEAKYFSIMMDCTPDVSKEEQLSIIIRILDMGNKSMSTIPCIKEYFIEFINVHSTTGYDLTNILLNKLNRIGIDLKDCRGQAYDNGANMKGQYKGVQSRIIAKNPRAYFSPCACHNLNLLLGDIAKSSTVAVGFFGTIQRIYCLFASSTKRWGIFKKHCTFLTLKPLSETRWECKVNSIKAIRYQVPELITALEEVADNTSDPKTKSEAQSLVTNELESYEFILSLIIWYEILVEVNTVSKTLQNINIHLDKCSNLLNGLIQFLKSFRMNGFESSKIKANEISDVLNIDKTFKKKRIRKTKKQFDYENSDEINDDPENNFRTFYFNVIADGAISSFSQRFNQFQIYNNNFSFLYNIGKLSKVTNDDLMKNCLDLQNYLSDGDLYDIVASELYEELLVFRHTMKEDSTPIEALSFLKTMPGAFTAFPNIVISLRILLTIPITSASAERSFSKLKIIKNYLRNTISQKRLTELATIAIENETADTLDFKNVIELFASKKSRKKF
ncbi:hypothetical protein QTP88_010542 [Uroleucon formosanum]